MIPLLTRESARALDRDAMQRLRIPGSVLMENAGLGATQVLLQHFGPAAKRALIVGGVGQNGGDAWVVARQLLVRGYAPRCFIVGDPLKVQGDARPNLDALTALGCAPEICGEGQLETLQRAAKHASLIVDGLFGTGLDRDIGGLGASVIAALNASGTPIFSLDLPSGIDADTGQVRGSAIRAACTATFGAHKRGLHQYPGVAHAGTVHFVSIGVPLQSPPDVGLIEAADIAAMLPSRPGDAHKGTNGRVLIVAGSAGKTGAAVLAAIAALRAGAGLVTVATDPETQRALDQKVLEVMTAPLPEGAQLAAAHHLASGQDAVLIGPGLGVTDDKRALARALALELFNPCVLDADALTAFGTELDLLRGARGPRVLTPHPGEAARLLGCSVREVEADRHAAASRIAESSGHIVVLKGARTIVASPGGSVRVCRSGHPALGTAGTGDVLGGTIAALCVALDPFSAAWAGVELHARAGSLAARADRGLLASEVAQFLPTALAACRDCAAG